MGATASIPPSPISGTKISILTIDEYHRRIRIEFNRQISQSQLHINKRMEIVRMFWEQHFKVVCYPGSQQLYDEKQVSGDVRGILKQMLIPLNK